MTPQPILPGRSGPQDFRPGDLLQSVDDHRRQGVVDLLLPDNQIHLKDVAGSFAPHHFTLVQDADGWRPFGGGENPAPGFKVAVLTQGNDTGSWDKGVSLPSGDWLWDVRGQGAIVAYRITGDDLSAYREAEARIDPLANLQPGDGVSILATFRGRTLAGDVVVTMSPAAHGGPIQYTFEAKEIDRVIPRPLLAGDFVIHNGERRRVAFTLHRRAVLDLDGDVCVVSAHEVTRCA